MIESARLWRTGECPGWVGVDTGGVGGNDIGMSDSDHHPASQASDGPTPEIKHVEQVCPVCGAPLIPERCKIVCRSQTCGYRIVFNCSEF